MFMFSLVARMPIIRPAEPVITPADRSNSPPIISRATATDGMPIVEATSVQFEMPSRCRNRWFCVQKKIAMTTAASRAPISGRRRIRAMVLIWASRSSPAGWSAGAGAGGCAGAADCLGELSCDSPRRRAAGRRADGRPRSSRYRVPASASLATVAALVLSTKPGPVRTGRPPPTVLAFSL